MQGEASSCAASDPASSSTRQGGRNDPPLSSERRSDVASARPHLPLTAAINPLHRAFVPRQLPENLDGHLRFPRALAANGAQMPPTRVAKALCDAIKNKIGQFEVNHRRGAARRGLPAQMTMSAKVLAAVVYGNPSDQPSDKQNGICSLPLSSVENTPASPPTTDQGTLCYHCRKPSAGSSLPIRAPVKIQVKPFTLPPLPKDWDKMLDAVQDSWQSGLNGSPALKTLVCGSTTCVAMASNKQLFGRGCSSMLFKRGAIAKAATRYGGWSALRVVLRRERAARESCGASFPYNEVHKYCAALASRSDSRS